ncbi:MAG TPA: GNAT family N-acetyltransferase [Gaiellaceae bacterium]|nr:GNAT family N-acetyltransferase [Gaiellaceae bacterium]
MNVRPATPEDVGAVAELFTALEKALLGHSSSFDVEAVRGWWQTIDYETNTWLIEEEGRLVAAAGGQVHDSRANSAGGVHPDAFGRGFGTRLLELAENRFVDEGATRLHSWTIAADEPASRLLSRRGYREVRRFWDMAVEFEQEAPEPAVAADVFREEDAEGFHSALEEAFSDHWEHHPESFDEWWARQRARSNYDPSLWLLVREDGEVVAACRNEIRPSGGYVGALGVRRDFRGRGYARALLHHSFLEFRRRGMTRATLGVDAANPTGATKLYESVGMSVELETIVWEKVLA